MARTSHRTANQRDNYRPGAEDSDRSHGGGGRSRSRERRRTPPPPRRRPESWRSPDARDHDRLPPSRRERERSIDSRRSGRPHSPSPHRPPRIERGRARSPDLAESRHHRHSQKRRSLSPPSKRRRSISPYSSSKKSSKKSKRPRSPPPRPSSPSRRGRPREHSISPRRVLSPPRSTRKPDNRPPTRGSERSRSPLLNARRRPYSPRSPPPRHQRHRSSSRHSPLPPHHRMSSRPPSRRYSPPAPHRRSPEVRRCSPPPRKRRDPPVPSSRNHSPGSPKRRRLSRSPRADRSPLPPPSASQYELKERKSDRELFPILERKRDKELHPLSSTSRKEASLRYIKPSSPSRPKSPIPLADRISTPSDNTREQERAATPPRPIPSFESTSDKGATPPRSSINHEGRESGKHDKLRHDGGNNFADNSRNEHEPDDRPASPPSDYRPPASFTNGPPVNPDRAARFKQSGGFGKPKGWLQNPDTFSQRSGYFSQGGFSSANTTPQGQGHGPGPAPFYQHPSQQQYGQNPQSQGSYQQSYRSSNPPGGFRPNQFTPISEPGHRSSTQHGFQLQGPPPSQPRGRGINIFMGSRGGMGRGRIDPHHRHGPPLPPPPPVTVPPPPPPDTDSPQGDADDNPYRPASFRMRDELEEEEEEQMVSVLVKRSEDLKQNPSESAPTVESVIIAPSEPSKNLHQAIESAQMPPPQSRPTGPAAQTPKRRPPSQPASENSKGFRPFSLSLSNKARNANKIDTSHRLRALSTREKAPEPSPTPPSTSTSAPLQSAGAQATSQVVEALKAVAERERMAPPPPPQSSQAGASVSSANSNDPHRFSVYERLTMVGEGTYGKVYKAKNKNTQELVALKRIRMESERDGFPITAVREMKLLQSLKHRNIISLLETMVERSPAKTHSDFYVVFEYMDHDLTGILNHPTFQLELTHIKHLARQFFQGLEYLHHRGVLHRDIKASNILLDSNGLLKLADFGLARFYQKRKKGLDYTNRIITLWYRPPEILLGDTAYGPAVDIWSAGCVFTELFTRVAVFPGTTEINQLDVIYELLGTPTKNDWPMLTQMPWYELLKPPAKRESKFDEKYKDVLSPAALDLVKKTFSFDPDKRPTATEVLAHPYFTLEAPEASPCSLVHLKGDWHEFEAKSRKRKERAAAAKEREQHASRKEMASSSSVGASAESRQR